MKTLDQQSEMLSRMGKTVESAIKNREERESLEKEMNEVASVQPSLIDGMENGTVSEEDMMVHVKNLERIGMRSIELEHERAAIAEKLAAEQVD